MGKKKGQTSQATTAAATPKKRTRRDPLAAALDMLDRTKASAMALANRLRVSRTDGIGIAEAIESICSDMGRIVLAATTSKVRVNELINMGHQLTSSHRGLAFGVGDKVQIIEDKRTEYEQGGLFSDEYLAEEFFVKAIAVGTGRAPTRVSLSAGSGGGGLVVKAAHLAPVAN